MPVDRNSLWGRRFVHAVFNSDLNGVSPIRLYERPRVLPIDQDQRPLYAIDRLIKSTNLEIVGPDDACVWGGVSPYGIPPRGATL